MRWEKIKEKGFIEIDGRRYSLSHLQDCSQPLHLPASDKKPAINTHLYIQYSSHCVSVGPKNNGTFDFSTIGQDKMIQDHRGIQRRFCPDRYELSKQLPSIFKSILDKKCVFTGKHNWLVIELVCEHGVTREYEIYFTARKSDKPKSGIRVVVESAYIRDAEMVSRRPKNFKRQQKIKGTTLFAKIHRGEPTKPPPKR